jgi:phage/plasmid-like protein (TIGR03299 family)
MAHNLNETKGKTSMMYFGETPWHRLGVKLDKPATAAEAIESAGLNFAVEKWSLRTEQNSLQVENHYATVRTDTDEVLGVVGSRYEPIQNKDAFTTFDTLVGDGEAVYHTAGALGNGERIWILAKLPDYIRINGNDLVEKFLLLTNSHDGSSVVRVKLTPIRVVCENTLSVALSGTEQEVRIRHTIQGVEKLKEAHEILGLSNRLYVELESIFNRMNRMKVTAPMLTKYVEEIFPDLPNLERSSKRERIREKVFELAEIGTGAEMAKGTLWGAYNAVTEFVDHVRLDNKTDSARLKSMWFGSGEGIKKRAFTVATEMLN